MHRIFGFAVGLGVIVAAACAPSSPGASSYPQPARPTSGGTAPTSPASPQAGQILQLGSVTYANHGTKGVQGTNALVLEAGDFYFSPTFLRGAPGQKLKLEIENKGRAPHTFTLPEQKIDQTIPPGGKATVEVTLPQSGVLRFLCRFHAARGMNGELLAGDATPQPASSQPAGPTPGMSPSGYGY